MSLLSSFTHLALISPYALIWLVVLLFIVFALGIGLFYKLQVRPFQVFQIGDSRVEIYCIPLWSLRKIKGDAFITFCNETGYLGEGMAKTIRDKADYRLDDTIERGAPYPPTTARAFPVRRLPCRYLIITNIYNEKGIVTKNSFRTAFTNAIKEGEKLNVATYIVPDPTDDWNYFEHRANPDLAARFIYDSILTNQKSIRCIKILTTRKDYSEAYYDQARRMQQEKLAA
ncbi:MAG TPA: hypothetical protein VNK96_03490 [Fimbriimonadales bacterium]|nr:hypothetical protein [Fimbriimonadales bacterium]